MLHRIKLAEFNTMEMVELEGLSVVVDRVVYQSDMVTPEDRPHCFAYFITIRNNSNITVTIKGRKWVVNEANGNKTVVEGDGVVGMFPELESGESFDYHSFHLFSGDWAVATGSYIGVDANGRSVITRIPEFRMDVPSHLS
ncbi:MAG: Co(2+)/Mg(2+) efflux protein ApaG [Verrucomicrobiota bacterium]